MIKLLSLFSGIGAPEKALTNLGIDYDLVAYSEIDKYASKAYAIIHDTPETKNLGDITKIDTDALPEDIDLITYGYPCQDISLAGKQRGFTDENGERTRSGLFFEALRIIQRTQPKVAIAENVKGLTGVKFKDEFKIVLDSLNDAGYNNYWKVLNAKDYGIPQNRERVFIISVRKDLDIGEFLFPPKQELNLRLKDILEQNVDEKYYLKDAQIQQFTYLIKDKELSNAIRVGGRGSIDRHSWDLVTEPVIAASRGRYTENGVTNTLTTVQKDNLVIEPTQDMRIRKLTPKECWRLMGFADADIDRCINAGISNTQLYKQAGNSIVVNVLENLFKNILTILDR